MTHIGTPHITGENVTMAASPSIIVTGASSGIGAAVAKRFREGGWRVTGFDLRPAGSGSMVVDMADIDAVSVAVAQVVRDCGAVHAVVSAAGHYEMIPFDDIDSARWERMLRVHLGGAFNLARAVLPSMREQGEGCMAFITSELAIGGGGGDAHYAASKGAIIGFIRSLAAEVAGYGVRVNGIAPGPTDTPLLPADSPWRNPSYLATLPTGNLASPLDIAETAWFVIAGSDYLNGEIVSPNSGAVI